VEEWWEEWWEGVVVVVVVGIVITDVDGEEVCCADSGCDMFTCVVIATPGSVLTD